MSPSTASEAASRGWKSRLGGVWHEVWKAALTVAFAGLTAWLVAPWIQTILTSPSCDDPGDLHLVTRSDLTAEATSVNDPEDQATYEAALAIDGDSSSAWVEGSPPVKRTCAEPPARRYCLPRPFLVS